MVTVPAFDLIRKFKEVDSETERLVLKRVRSKVTQDELFKIFEKGVAGEYGKFYTADPQTLIGWVNKYVSNRDSSGDYLKSGLIPVNISYQDSRYPLTSHVWRKEVNKCFQAFLQGVSFEYYHPLCYTQMQMDDRIELNEYQKYYKGDEINEIHKAQQRVMADKFSDYREMGYTFVYFIDESKKDQD